LNKAPNLCVTQGKQLVYCTAARTLSLRLSLTLTLALALSPNQVYCTAALAIVFDPASGTQRYFDLPNKCRHPYP